MQETGGSRFAPTAAGDEPPDCRLFREEVFGPVLTATRFRAVDEALALADGTGYGRSATAWTNSLSKARKMIAGLESGVVLASAIRRLGDTAPDGGAKQPGNGTDRSLRVLDGFLNLNTAWVHL